LGIDVKSRLIVSNQDAAFYPRFHGLFRARIPVIFGIVLFAGLTKDEFYYIIGMAAVERVLHLFRYDVVRRRYYAGKIFYAVRIIYKAPEGFYGWQVGPFLLSVFFIHRTALARIIRVRA
jgi:hypothetical protein